MIMFHERLISIMVLYAIALHICWVAIILLDDSAVGATALSALHKYIPDPLWLAVSIGLAAMLAVFGLYTHVPWIVVLLLPQQLLLIASAAGSFEAIYLSQYADGVVRSRAFIAADQIYSIIAMLGHTAAIIAHAKRLAR